MMAQCVPTWVQRAFMFKGWIARMVSNGGKANPSKSCEACPSPPSALCDSLWSPRDVETMASRRRLTLVLLSVDTCSPGLWPMVSRIVSPIVSDGSFWVHSCTFYHFYIYIYHSWQAGPRLLSTRGQQWCGCFAGGQGHRGPLPLISHTVSS